MDSIRKTGYDEIGNWMLAVFENETHSQIAAMITSAVVRGEQKPWQVGDFRIGDEVVGIALNREDTALMNEYHCVGVVGQVVLLDGDILVVDFISTGVRYHFRNKNLIIVKVSDFLNTETESMDRRIKPDFSHLDGVIIDTETKEDIRAVLMQHQFHKKIFDDWDLKSVIEYGRGMTLLFHGPPGTGKTHMARAIAKTFKTDVLVISAAEIQSQEPGGANRNLQQAFRTAKHERKVLLLDECDSLIANRANLGMILASEVNTLLTEIEKFDGIVVLTTNRLTSLDEALQRRIALIAEFPEPDETQREAIWARHLPTKLPLAKNVTAKKLATYELTGGLIKNALLQAARLAAMEEKDAIELKHFERAITKVKNGQGIIGRQRIQHQDGVGVGSGVTKGVDKRMTSNITRLFG